MTTIGKYTYEVDESNVLRIWDDEARAEDGSPWIYQPHKPGAYSWVSKEEAEAWAAEFINSLLNPPVEEPEVVSEDAE